MFCFLRVYPPFPAKITNGDDVVLLLGGIYVQTTRDDANQKKNMKQPPSFDICMCHQSGECKNCAI